MSRKKKSRSLKRVTGGVETGTKERTKLENKQNKARKKADAAPGKVSRQRSVYQKAVDDENSAKSKKGPTKLPPLDMSALKPKKDDTKQAKQKPEAEMPDAKLPEAKPVKKEIRIDDIVIETKDDIEMSDDDLFNLLENPGKSDNF
jgi:uncharacterized protein YgiM (DUF1202 family)